jgi:hypothetical protein
MCKKNTNTICGGHRIRLFLFQIKRLSDFIIKHLKTKNIIMKTLQTLLLALALTALTMGALAQSNQTQNAYALNDEHPLTNPTSVIAATDNNTGADSITQGSLTAIGDVSNIAINRAYPNPVTSEFQVDVSSGSETNATIKLIDVIGRTELERPVKLIYGQNHFEVNMDDMAGGLYQLVVQTDNKRVVYKVMKTR